MPSILNASRFSLYLLLVVVLIIAGCRQQDAAVVPTNAPPTVAPTPRSTALPTVEGRAITATEANPLRMVVVIDGSLAARERAQDSVLLLETAITEQSAGYVENGFIASPLIVRVETVESNAEALAALCTSLEEAERSVAWLDGLGYAGAQACASPALLISQGTGRAASTGDQFALITRRELSLGSVAAAAGRTACRLAFDDRTTWVIPSLILRASGVDPVTGLGEVLDVEDADSLYDALAGGDCDFAGIRLADFESLDESLADELVIIDGSETPELPYNMLLYPTDIPLGIRVALNGTLIAIADDQPEALDGLLQLDGLLALESEAAMMRDLTGENVDAADIDLEALQRFLFSTGLDFTQLGE